ncbi:hypothetical protein RMR16_001000 [Agrobacterium sp. rho-13.3]|uniref:hypothetical protein n=1 Tax=Agrobacterium sp. rho-13.3 TaxID=3072980 RepID=UPI002A15FEDA|nr:hypothetical protein [Agrobacterium sp. rho-13.3]MDX8310494.1 hypothetical protein [Agrobacterium sp. rho-13.3]
MNGALTKYLKDFSQITPPDVSSSLDLDTPVAAFENDWLSEPEVSIDLEEEKRKAFAAGEEAGKRQALDTHEVELEALRASHQQELEAMRTRYEEEIAMHLATSVTSMKKAITEHAETVCFRLFSTVMEREFADKASTEVAAQIVREIEGGFAGTIKIMGPELLLSKIREHLQTVDNHIDYDVNADIDVQVQLDNSVLMTRLSEFFQTVRGLADE